LSNQILHEEARLKHLTGDAAEGQTFETSRDDDDDDDDCTIKILKFAPIALIFFQTPRGTWQLSGYILYYSQ
jgi:hypothetical protein